MQACGEAAFCRRQTEEEEGNVDNGGNNKHIDGQVRGLHRVDTGDRQRRRLQRNGNNNDNNEEGGSHPTPGTMAMRVLAVRLHYAGILYALEASSSDVDKANGQ